METEIQKVEPTQSPIMRLAEMVQQSDGKIDAAGLKELLAVQMIWEANEARKAYVEAMAAFKKAPPEIVKDRTVSYGQTKYNHASLANVTACINSALSEHGLSGAWKTEQIPATEHEKTKVKVTCKITHIMGHSEETSLSALPDDSGKKNLIQQIGSTVTYLQRYTLLALTGLATYEDDDGNGSGKKPTTIPAPTPAEQKAIDEIASQIPAPPGKRVDTKKVGAICYEKNQSYPDETIVDRAVAWFGKYDRPEIFIPENRSDFEIGQDMPGDEDSVPDTPTEVQYQCQKCGLKFDTPKQAAECIC